MAEQYASSKLRQIMKYWFGTLGIEPFVRKTAANVFNGIIVEYHENVSEIVKELPAKMIRVVFFIFGLMLTRIDDENFKSVIQEQQTKLVEKTDLSLGIAFGAIGVLHLISTMQYFSCKQEIKKLQQENDQLKAELKLLRNWSIEIDIYKWNKKTKNM